MRDRILTAVVGVLVILYALFFNSLVFNILVGLLIAMCSYELIKMFASCHGAKMSYGPLLGSAFFYVAYFVAPDIWASLGLTFAFFFSAVVLILRYPNLSFRDYLYGLFVPIYGAWTAIHLMILYNSDRGLVLLLYFFIAIWLCDTGAYFAGRFFGRRKLAPELSPNKTMEGAVGGLVLAALAGLLFQLLVPVFTSASLAILYSVIFALGGILGDLFESFLKRYCCVKDSGCVLPGHGGFLDRFDSILFTAPLAAYLFSLGESVGYVL